MTQQSPQEIIEAQRALVARLEAELDHARVQLGAMEIIYQAMPTRRRAAANPGRHVETGQQPSVGGRQPGAISMRWRKILMVLHKDLKPFNAARAAEVVTQMENRSMKPSEAKRILEGYVAHGYVTRDTFGNFEVTDDAANRFAFAELDEMLTSAGGSVDFVAAPPPPVEVNPFVLSPAAPAPVVPPPPALAAPVAPPPSPQAVPVAPPPPFPPAPPPPLPTPQQALGNRAVLAPLVVGTNQFYGGGPPK